MIYGIGTDIVRVARMRRNLERYGDRFASRILTPLEMAEFAACKRRGHFLAKRFAAKEAAVKALGTGFSKGLGPRQIGVVHDANGKPGLEYYGPAKEYCERVGVDKSLLSIADEDEYAVAFVTLLMKTD
ncbi:MAG: holo-ACP synthase [Gammaproteobacteria bacterium]